MHRENIARLLTGRERKLGEKATPVEQETQEGAMD
jgi:hypothetical protein